MIFFQINLNFGIWVVYILGATTSLTVMNIICGVVVIAYSFAFMALPESPMYLMIKLKPKEAKESLRVLRGKKYNYDNELAEIQEEINEMEAAKLTFLQEIRKKSTRKAFIIVCLLFLFFQMTGEPNERLIN